MADGNRASIGDVIITRANRRLRLTATDWVANGDRWTITAVSKHSDLTVRHTRSHLTTRLPADYVQTSTRLGYATTIHAAQGVTADTMHGLLVVGDGDPVTIIRPETVAPRTPTEILQQILPAIKARLRRADCGPCPARFARCGPTSPALARRR